MLGYLRGIFGVSSGYLRDKAVSQVNIKMTKHLVESKKSSTFAG